MNRSNGGTAPLQSFSRLQRYASLPGEGPLDEISEQIEEIINFGAPSTCRLNMYESGGQKMGLGSGFYLRIGNAVYVCTAAHCVAPKLVAFFPNLNGAEFDATVVGISPNADTALLKLASTVDVRELELADEKENGFSVKRSERVIAVGNPLGLGNDTSYPNSDDGGVMDLHEGGDIDPRITTKMVAFDATILPGNSGGPSFNTKGQVPFLNVAGFMGSQLFLGTPSLYVRELADSLNRDSAAVVFTDFWIVDSQVGPLVYSRRTSAATPYSVKRGRVSPYRLTTDLRHETYVADSMASKVIAVGKEPVRNTADIHAILGGCNAKPRSVKFAVETGALSGTKKNVYEISAKW